MSTETRNTRKTLVGVVTNRSGDKSIKVTIPFKVPHPRYKKVINRQTVLHVHDEKNETNPGDKVEVMETRPISRLKRWRVINVVDLMTLQPKEEHPHGLSDKDFDALFTRDRPILFAYHGYPWLIHRLAYRRANHANLHVRGYKEEGTTTTPFDMVVLNDLDRFHLVSDVMDRVPKMRARAPHIKQAMRDRLVEHKNYIERHGEDMPEIRDWKWPW